MHARYFPPGLGLAVASLLLYGRAGYGPFGDRGQRGKPCTADRCVHSASIFPLAAAVSFAAGRRHVGRAIERSGV